MARAKYSSDSNPEEQKNYDIPLDILESNSLSTGDYLTVMTHNSIYQFQVVSKSEDGQIYVQVLKGQNMLRMEYGALEQDIIRSDEPFRLKDHEGGIATTSNVEKIFISTSPKKFKRDASWNKEPEGIKYNENIQSVDVENISVGDFIHLETDSESTYVLEVIDKYDDSGGIRVRMVETNNPKMKGAEGDCGNVRFEIGQPLFGDFIHGGESSNIASIKLTKVYFGGAGQKDDWHEQKEPPKQEKVSANPFTREEKSALHLLGLDPKMDPKDLTKDMVKRAHRKLATKYHQDRFHDGDEGVGELLMQNLNGARELLYKYLDQ